MMRFRLRLSVSAGSTDAEYVYTRFPVKIGRHAQSDCQIVDTSVSRWHALLDYQGGTLLVRDMESRNGTFASERNCPIRHLRGSEFHASPGGEITLSLGSLTGVRVVARLEEVDGADLPDAFAPAAREAALRLSSVCRPENDLGSAEAGLDALRPIVDALLEGLMTVRRALGRDEPLAGSDGGQAAHAGAEPQASMLEWVQSLVIASRIIDQRVGRSASTSSPAWQVRREAGVLASCVDTGEAYPSSH